MVAMHARKTDFVHTLIRVFKCETHVVSTAVSGATPKVCDTASLGGGHSCWQLFLTPARRGTDLAF